MSRNRDELKKGLPKLESMLIDFLLDSGIGPKHIKGNIVLQYAPKIQELCDSITKIRQTALKEIDGGSEIQKDLVVEHNVHEKEVNEMLAKIDAEALYKLSEKPINPISVTVLDNDLNPVEITIEEKPIDGLEDADFDREITRIWGKCAAEPNDQIACLHIESFIEIARHFTKWGAERQKEQGRTSKKAKMR